MKNIIVILFLTTLFAMPAWGQVGFNSYHERTDFLMSSPGSMKFGLYGYGNPAVTSTLHQPDVMFHWSDDGGFTDFNRWGVFAAAPHAGFGALTQRIGDIRYTDYRISTAIGSDIGSIGAGYGWYGGDTDVITLEKTFSMGTLLRPDKRLSIGLFGTRSVESSDYEAVLDIALRPFGTEWLTLFGDFAANSTEGIRNGVWSAGASIEALPGVRLTSRYIDNLDAAGDYNAFTAGIQVSFGRGGIGYQSHMDTDGNHAFNSYSIRIGAYDRNVADAYFREDEDYYNVSLSGELEYQRRPFLDESNTLQQKLDALKQAAEDPTVAGVVVNATASGINSAMAWEIGQQMAYLQQNDKRVILYLESGGMNMLQLIPHADKVVMDPQGGLALPGYFMGTTYLAELLSSVGIGVDEFREMEYKSVFEQLSRTEMSEADREQRQALIDGFYEQTRGDVTEGRELSEAEYDSLINIGSGLRPAELVGAGVVDTLVRYSEIQGVIEDFEGESKQTKNTGDLIAYNLPRDHHWGVKPEIAVLYAIGPTMINSGIRGRQLAGEIRKMRNDGNVKAVVMRADSPGGAVLASDLVAEEIKKTTEEKPVIVSMGGVAASGGYWISMYADEIMALPSTVTGSIGVIGGWLYDDGVSDHLNLHADHVQKGESADLMFGPTLPLIGLSLPHRELTEEERSQFIERLNLTYDDFVERVAEGRDMDEEAVREVAAGRVWTGKDALDADLVDGLGSLSAAIDRAHELSDIGEDETYTITEGPELPMFELPGLMSLVGIEQPHDPAEDPMVDYLKMMIDNSGKPAVALPFEYYHYYYRLTE